MNEIILGDKIIEIRKPRDPDEYRKITDAQLEVWGMKDYSGAVAHHMLIACDRRGGIVIGAFEKDTGKVVGFAFGILAKSPEGKLYHYSHMTGVIPEQRYKGLGYFLKLKQRELVLEQGLDFIAWTYDPLQSSNARFNIGKLGVIVRKFYVDYYGELTDSINIGMPTDRFEAEWWIKSKRVELRIKEKIREPSLNELLNLGAKLVTKTEVSDDFMILSDYSLKENANVVLVEVPSNLNRLRDFRDMMLKWRLSLRNVFDHYINKENYVVVEFIKEAEQKKVRYFYVLWRKDLEHILEGEFPWR